MSKPRLGISSCLLGEKVRYDGNHKMDPYLVRTLGRFVDYVPVCPEFECGLGVPREPMRLVGDPDCPRLVTIKTGVDLTERMEKWSEKRLRELAREDLCGFIFKSRSPSSGMERVKVYDKKGFSRKAGSGVFARAFMERFPELPVEEEGRLHDPALRENFLERVFLLHTWKETCLRNPSARRSLGALVDFHARMKLTLLAHSPSHYQTLGRMIATAKGRPIGEVYSQYIAGLMNGLKKRPTAKTHCNALQHAFGFFKNHIDSGDKQEFLDLLEQFRLGHVPLLVPVTLLRHYTRKHGQTYLERQAYLDLSLRRLGLL